MHARDLPTSRLYESPVAAHVVAAVLAVGLMAMAGTAPLRADDSVIGSPHDLSALSPHPIRAVHEDQVCVFCHVPHTSTPQTPAWRRHNPEIRYRIYQSSTTDARIGQPSGVSKMCLSCHDGLMAPGMSGQFPLSADAAPADHVVMTRRFLPPGESNLTNDLRDDHPIGFRYDRALSRRDPQLRPPDLVSRTLPLGKHNEVHCTACHDPHNNRLGDFLRITDRGSALCVACHDLTGWRASSHAVTPVPTPGRRVDPTERMKYPTLADNACAACHKVHSAPHPERLLRFEREEDNCLNCHDGSVARSDILAEIRKSSAHRGERRTGVHDPTERPRSMRPHVECVDCHNPHAVRPANRVLVRGLSPAPADGTLTAAPGVNAFGHEIDRAQFAYEVCLRCHADNVPPTRTRLIRQVHETNTRLEFATSNASFHPVFGPRRNPDVVSLMSPLRIGSVLACTDCHNSDNSRVAGGSGPEGPHGSRFAPLLANRYDTRDFTVESAAAYALCYRCHDRTSILRDDSFPFHRLHIVVARTPCSACHDPHGVRPGGAGGDHTNLINFDTTIVRPVRTGRGLEPPRYTDTGRYSGTCTLTCHGVDHVNLQYGTAGVARGRR